MTIFFASSLWVDPSSAVTSTSPGALIVPSPIKASILFFLKRKPTPLTLAATVSSLCFIMAARSSFGAPVITPKPASSCAASANFSDAWSSAFEGMQPILRQVPPCVLRFSTTRDLEAKLRRPDRADIAAGTGSDNDEIIGHEVYST